jgi:hypothetical protein
MEGNYYLCGWRTLGVNVETWILADPNVRTVGPSFEAADELLSEEICEQYGDGESKREYVPSAPLKGGKKRFLIQVWGDTFIDAVNKGELFDGKPCEVCRAVNGRRTTSPVVVEKAPGAKNGFMVSCGGRLNVFSRKFVDLIQARSGIRLRWQSVLANGAKDGAEWVELIGGEFVSEATPKGARVSGWRCQTCGNVRVLACVDSAGVREFLRMADLGTPVPALFPIKHQREIALGMRDDFWAEIRKSREAKGISSQPLGIVPDTEVSDLARLRSYQEYQANPEPIIS